MSLPTDRRNYYEVLHVSRDAPVEIIRGSYRTLMQQLKHHPDLGGDTSTAARINEAYAVLSNASRRAEYDARLDVMEQVAQNTRAEPSEPQAAAAGRGTVESSRQCVFCAAPHGFGASVELDAVCGVCHSPLATAENRRMESAGKRAVERIGKHQQITYFTHWPQRTGFIAQVEDLSLNGLRMVTREELAGGQRIKIQ
ncbi:MAG: J domain-containing protein, partial [Woeseiaceae bacterium]|nr:J domain-containing protein [Woeseiaceae bacterium]